MLEDKRVTSGFGTTGGGVSKFDGKSFTHYAEKKAFQTIMLHVYSKTKAATSGSARWWRGEQIRWKILYALY
jgi:hypothetical protein